MTPLFRYIVIAVVICLALGFGVPWVESQYRTLKTFAESHPIR